MTQIALFVIPTLVVIFVFALIKTWLDQRAQARAERVRLLEEALKNPAIDRPTIESLTYQLTGARSPRAAGSGRMMAGILALGWLATFAGVGLWVMGEWTHDNDVVAGGIITAIIGFGFVTYPFALRELEARRAQQ